MIEKRGYRRQRVLKQGTLDCGLDGLFSCQVRDMNDKGARIRLLGCGPLPQKLKLRISSKRFVRTARVRWRAGLDVGLRFLAFP